MGRCIQSDTLVCMADGSTLPIRDICVGDRVMGDTRKTRTVLSLASGTGQMYDCSGIFRCTADHILCIKFKGQVAEMTVKEILQLAPAIQSQLNLYRIILQDGCEQEFQLVVERLDCEDTYCSITLDGNQRFMLADGTVTHDS